MSGPGLCTYSNLMSHAYLQKYNLDLHISVDDDMRLIVKPVSCKQENFKTYMGDCAREVIQQLLVALTLRYDDSDDDNGGKKPVCLEFEFCSVRQRLQVSRIAAELYCVVKWLQLNEL